MVRWCAVVVVAAASGCFKPSDELNLPAPPAAAMPAQSAACTPAPAPCSTRVFPPDLIRWTRESSLVLRGTVTRLDASTVSSVAPSGLYVVRVDRVLAGTDLARGFAGREITVQPLGARPAVGTEAWFFAQPWVIGDGLAVREIAEVAPGLFPDLELDVPAIQQRLADRALFDDLQQASAVLAGTVTGVGAQLQTNIGSEHDPLWADATVNVGCVLRDVRPSPGGATAVVRFPTSTDILWSAGPRLTANQQAIVVLHEGWQRGGLFDPASLPGAFTGAVVHQSPADVRELADLQHLVDVLACPPVL